MFNHFRNRGCDRVRNLLSAYMDGYLSPEETERVKTHLEECQRCREELDSLQATVDLVRCLPIVTAPRSFEVAVPRLIPRPAFFGTLRLATAVAAVFLAFFFTADVTHLFVESVPTQVCQPEVTPLPLPATVEPLTGPSEGALENPTPSENILEPLPTPGIPPEVNVLGKKPGWLWPLELAFMGLVIVLGGMNLFIWERWRRKMRL